MASLVGIVERFVAETGVGASQARRDKDRTFAENAAREIELQFQVPVNGTAGAELVFQQVEIFFDYALHYDPGRRQSNLEEPHFTYGSRTSPPMGVHATVKEWIHDKNTGAITGAIVSIGVVGRGDYKGMVHLTFQGLGTFIEPEDAALMNGG